MQRPALRTVSRTPEWKVMNGMSATTRALWQVLETMAQWWRQYGDALRFRLGPKLIHLLSHPDLAEEILVHQSDRFVKVYDPRRPSGLALVLGSGLVTSSRATPATVAEPPA